MPNVHRNLRRPNGVLVRPAEFAADTYTKPELPEEAKENTERGAEAAAEHYLALLVYAWNTGDTQPFADMSSPSSQFASAIVRDVNARYDSGWTYGLESNITHVLRVEPIEANGKDVPFVEIKQANGSFKKAFVKLGASDGINVQVLSGIDKNSEIKVWNPSDKDKEELKEKRK